MMIAKFFVTAIFSLIVLSVVSIAWPKFTGTPRPEPLVRIHEIVKNTTMGRQTAAVLGVRDERKVTPIDPQELAGQVKDWAADAVRDRATQIVTKQAVNQIRNGYDSLNSQEKEILREAICKPATASPEKSETQ